MANELRFDGKVAIITGAGNGLGRSHALLLGSRGAKVVVNDLGGSRHGEGKSSAAADKVVEEIKAAGGQAVANYDSVEEGDKIVKSAIDAFGQVDIIVNNAGILRDTSFHKMTQEDWDLIYRVHVKGSFSVTHAAWNHMRDRGYGRIIFTASAAGIYGNFGQANYSMAKLGLLGLSNTLAIEGHKKGIHVNTIAPIAGSRLTETVMPKELLEQLKPEYVSPLVAYLCHESCEETGGLYEVGGGFAGKLRWQRAQGKLFKIGAPITPDTVAAAWKEISSFDKVSYPTDITASMQPILGNLNSKSKGGNQHIDCDTALAAEPVITKNGYDERDLSIYALGIGGAKDPLDTKELNYVFEMSSDGFQAFPTFAVIPALKAIFALATEGKRIPGLHYGFDRVLHGEQYTEVSRPLPRNAKLTHKIKIKDIFDKGKGAVVVTAITTTDESGEQLAYNELTEFVRGAGGWGGDRGPSADVNVPPERAPDATITEKTDQNQALLYRLSGDWNPLHADPAFAKNFGFERPILHGLCSFGFAARAVVKAMCQNDPRKFKSIKVRFADSVFPGETLVTEMWKESETRIVFRTKAKERDKVVISNAAVELYAEVPKAKAAQPAPTQAAAAAPTAAAAPAMPTSADLFTAIGLFLERNPSFAQKAQTIFQWKLTGPESQWIIDAKNGNGSCKTGTAANADVTLELADSDFMAMATGQADPQKLYFGGKLKISGNVMASMKMDFLKKMDPAIVVEVMQKRGASAPAAAPAPAAAASGAPAMPTSADLFTAIGLFLERNPSFSQKAQTIFQWKLTGPDSQWIIDAKNGNGGCKTGTAANADVTLELADSDFMAMATGQADPQKLYFGGKLKISGNVMASMKMDFLKKMDPAIVVEVMQKRGGGAAAAPAPAAKTAAAPPAENKVGKSSQIFAALKDRLAKNPGLYGEIGQPVQWNIRNPEAHWVMAPPGSVSEGSDKSAVATLGIDDDDLVSLVSGKAQVRDLFQRGKLRVDGDVRVAHKLGLMNNLI